MARNFASGGEYIEIGSNAIFDDLSATIAFRMRTSTGGQWEVAGRHQSNTSYNGWGFSATGASPNRIQMYGKLASGSPGNAFTIGDVNANISDGNWHSVVGRYTRSSGGTGDLMVDGISNTQATGVAAWSPVGQVIRLGRSIDGFWADFIGEIEDFAFWGARLTADEARAYCNGASPGSLRPQSLKLWLPLGGA